jgi:hypothetical protein
MMGLRIFIDNNNPILYEISNGSFQTEGGSFPLTLSLSPKGRGEDEGELTGCLIGCKFCIIKTSWTPSSSDPEE